jgi:hypothetical protein
MAGILTKVFKTRNERELRRLQRTVDEINALEPATKALSDGELRAKTEEFRRRIEENSRTLSEELEALEKQRRESSSPEESQRIKEKIKVCRNDILGNAKRAGEHAVGATNAALAQSRLHDSLFGDLDGVGRTYPGTGRILTVHADHRCGLWRGGALDKFEVDHRLTPVAVALCAGVHTGLAADATGRIDKKFHVHV